MLLAAVSIAGAVLLTRPEDPMARARRDLERRLRGTDPVVLIAEAGTPAWYRWESGATVFAESEFHDGACSVQSVIDSRLELVPAELVPPEFVFEADVRHDLFPDALSESGVYCLRGEWESTAEYRALSWLDVSFNDFPPPEDAVIKPDPPALRARAQTSLERAGQLDASGRNSIAMLYIEPAVARPHPWRYIRVKVTALGMEFQSERNGRPVPFGPLLVPARHLDEVSRSLATQLFPVRAGQPGANCPCWTRPGSLGLYVRSGKASFRNVVLTPIRGP
jgi:hypothetical protein